MKKTIKIIDLLNMIANGEELPKRIKYKCDIYIIGEDACNKNVKYIDEKKDENGYIKYLFQDWILDAILNDEVEIIEEDKKLDYCKSYECFEGVDDYIEHLRGKIDNLIDTINELKGGNNG